MHSKTYHGDTTTYESSELSDALALDIYHLHEIYAVQVGVL